MVFSFRKKRVTSSGEDSTPTTPSLPDFSNNNVGIGNAIAWPSSFVDEATLKADSEPDDHTPRPSPGARKISFSRSRNVDFHRPFRPNASTNGSSKAPDAESPMPSAWSRSSAISIRKRAKKGNPTFNLMVVGPKRIGKTSLLQLLLATSDLSPSLPVEGRSSLESFLTKPLTTTNDITELTVELLDGLSLTVVDTPGLDYREGRELVLEGQVNSIMREIERRYGDSVVEESRVVRTKASGKHIHLCIYIVDPTSLLPSSPSTFFESELDSEPAASETVPKLRATEIRTLNRLASRTNVLPVIGKIDSLTEEELNIVKDALNRDVEEHIPAGWGIFSNKGSKPRGRKPVPEVEEKVDDEYDEDQSDEAQDDEPAPPVIKIRSTRGTSFSTSVRSEDTRLNAPSPLKRTQSQSRIRRAQSHDHVSDEEFDVARTRQDIHEQISVYEGSGLDHGSMRKRISIASRFSSYTHGGLGGGPELVQHLLPFALVSPSPPKVPRSSNEETPFLSRLSTFSLSAIGLPTGGLSRDDDHMEDMFTRKYRWGTVDVLNPEHCDFVPMRSVIFGWGLKALKLSSHEAYERYRTERLLVRKARSLGYATAIDSFIASPSGTTTDKTPTQASVDGTRTSSARGRASEATEHGALERRGVSVDTMATKRKKKEQDEWVNVDADSQSLKMATGVKNGKALNKGSRRGGY